MLKMVGWSILKRSGYEPFAQNGRLQQAAVAEVPYPAPKMATGASHMVEVPYPAPKMAAVPGPYRDRRFVRDMASWNAD